MIFPCLPLTFNGLTDLRSDELALVYNLLYFIRLVTLINIVLIITDIKI